MLLALIEGLLVEYLANCMWQLPLFACGAWLLIRVVRPALQAQHWLWISALLMAVVLPARGVHVRMPLRDETPRVTAPVSNAPIVPGKARTPEVGAGRRLVAHTGSKAAHTAERGWKIPFQEAEISLSASAMHWLAGIYCMTILFGLVRFAVACRAARRLVQEASEVSLPQQLCTALEVCSYRFGIAAPQVLESAEIAGPAIVGARMPVMLLPERFGERAGQEIEAALLHELAHVERRDYFANMVCHLAAVPIAWHPAAGMIQRRIRRTREMLCDEMAAGQMRSSTDYACCLVSLAQGIFSERDNGHAVRLFENNTMEERVMQLTGIKPEINSRTKVFRVAVGACAMLVVVAAAAVFHVTPIQAAAQTLTSRSGLVAAQEATQLPEPRATTSAGPGDSTSSSLAPTSSTSQSPGSPGSGSATTTSSTDSGVSVSEDADDERTIIVTTGKDDDGPTAIAGEGATIHRWKSADGKQMVWANHDKQEPTPEEKQRIEQQLKDSQQKLSAADHLQGGRDLQLNDLKIKLGKPDKLKLDQLKILDSPAFVMQLPKLTENPPFLIINKDDGMNAPLLFEWNKEQMEAATKQLAEAKTFNSDEWKAQLAAAQKQFESAEVQRQFEKAKQLAGDSALNSAEWKAQMAVAQKQFKGAEVQREIEEAKRLLQDAEKQMQEMKKQ